MTSRNRNVVPLRAKLTDLELRGVAAYWLEGLWYDEIAKRCGGKITAAQVEDAVHNDLGYAPPSYTAQQLAEYREAYEAGDASVEQLADRFDLSPGQMQYALLRAGARMHRRGWRAPKGARAKRKVPKRKAR